MCDSGRFYNGMSMKCELCSSSIKGCNACDQEGKMCEDCSPEYELTEDGTCKQIKCFEN